MKKKFWLHQNAAIFCALLSFFVTPIMVYLNYLSLDDEEIILEGIESNFKLAWIVYLTLIVGALAFSAKSMSLSIKENKNILYSFISIVLTILSLLVFGEYFVGLFLAF